MYLIWVFEDVPDKGVCIIPYMRMYLIRVFVSFHILTVPSRLLEA